MKDLVNHPPHYTQHPSGVECIELTEQMNFNTGNAFKYLHRAALKGNQHQDLEKASWYLQREIDRIAIGGQLPSLLTDVALVNTATRYFAYETCKVRLNLWKYTQFGEEKFLNEAGSQHKAALLLTRPFNSDAISCDICGETLTAKDEMVQHPETGKWCCADHWPQEEPY